MNDIFSKLKYAIGDGLKENESLWPYTSFKIGGPARYFCVLNEPEKIKLALAAAEKLKVPVFILGGGSNVLVSDKGFSGLVIKIGGGRIKVKGENLEAEAGVSLSKAVGEALSFSLSGLEWAAGIPGALGGAIAGNAGAYGGEMGQLVEEVSVLSRGKIKILKNNDCFFSYHCSVFKEARKNDIILSAVLKLKKGEAEKIRQTMKEILSTRKEKIESQPSAGSFFRNVELNLMELKAFKEKFSDLPDKFLSFGKIPAGWLIEQCGLKGKKIGGAMISEKHAGIIINAGGATAEEVIMLISVIKQKVRDKFNLQLMEEVEYAGF